jgi:hypothetical protein
MACNRDIFTLPLPISMSNRLHSVLNNLILGLDVSGLRLSRRGVCMYHVDTVGYYEDAVLNYECYKSHDNSHAALSYFPNIIKQTHMCMCPAQ